MISHVVLLYVYPEEPCQRMPWLHELLTSVLVLLG